MLVPHHIEITRQAIGAEVGVRALAVILRANARQDGLRFQLGHAHFHFDNNLLAESYAHLEGQRALIRPALERGEAESAWRAFGRMIHAVQDFYAHTNYIPLWLSRFDSRTPPPPPEVDPVCPEILGHPSLHSGKLYYPLEALTFLPLIGRLLVPLFPADSHARMNHDGHHTSAQFDYVFHASVKRTRLEYGTVTASLSPALRAAFRAMP